MIEKKTIIIATQQNIEFIQTFCEANNMSDIKVGNHRVSLTSWEEEDNVHVEYFYYAVKLMYEDDHSDVLLMNLAIKHNGIENMLIDYLKKLRAYPIVMSPFSPKAASTEQVNENFQTNIKPKLRDDMKRKYPRVPVDALLK